MNKHELERIFSRDTVFTGWTVQNIFDAVKRVFSPDPARQEDILNRTIHKSLAKLREHWKQGRWSVGFCYYVAEVVRLMMIGALPDQTVQLKQLRKNTKEALPGKHGKHFVLFHRGGCFDPEKYAAVPQSQYACEVEGSRFAWGKGPSINAMVLLARVVQEAERNSFSPRITLAQLQPMLIAVAKTWEPGGPKQALKNEVRRLAGLSPGLLGGARPKEKTKGAQ